MTTRKIGVFLLIAGVCGLVFSLIVDLIGFGDGRIGASQLLGIQVGIMAAVIGATMIIILPDRKIHLKTETILGELYSLPPSFWIMLGFVLVYVPLYLIPVFLNPQRSMIYFNHYIPNKNPIGLDLEITMGAVTPWVTTGESPYPKVFYPPLTYILFAPMTLVNYPLSYILITSLTFLSYVVLGTLAFLLVEPKREFSMLALVFISGLFSYGFQFELERGQFNVIIFMLCMLSIFIFWRLEHFRYLAYLLFSVVVHVKLYPAIFILMFIRDWWDWKTNIKRFAGLAIFNVSLLFVLGYKNFLAFMDALLIQLRTPGWTWNGNHSIQAFVFNFLKDGYGLFSSATLATLQQNSARLSVALLVLIVSCILAVVIRAYSNRENGFNPFLLAVCTLGALIIPTSNDYTLPILVAPMGMFFSTIPEIKMFRNKLLAILLLLMVAVGYFSILYPFKYKPHFLENNFPPLFIMLCSITFLYCLRNRFLEEKEFP